MPLIDKEYFSLDELLRDSWRLSADDLLYLVSEAKLRLSVRLFSVNLEFGVYEEVELGQRCRFPYEEVWFDGLQDLEAWDAHTVLRKGEATVSRFHVAGMDFCEVARDGELVRVQRADLLVRKAERHRFEAAHGFGSPRRGRALRPAPDPATAYRFIQVGERLFVLGAIQARIVKLLHEAALTAVPWRPGKTLLTEAGSTSIRMVDIFKSQPDWRQLIASDKRGNYRLRVVCELPDLVGDSPCAVICQPAPDEGTTGSSHASSPPQRRRA